MSASEVATHSLLLAGITDSGTVIVDGVMLDYYSLSTGLSFHHIESVIKFTAEEEISPEYEQITEKLGGSAAAAAMATEIQGGIMSEKTISVIQQRQNHTVSAEMDPQIHTQPEPKHEQDTGIMTISPSGLFERKRTSSLAAALLSRDREYGCKTYVQFVSSDGAVEVIEICENEEESSGMERSVESVVGRLLFTLNSLKMSNPDRHLSAVRRLQNLEKELRDAGAVCPPDETTSHTVSKLLASSSPTSDIQIRVNSTQHVTTAKSVFETETPGLEGLDAATVQHLQQQLISNMSIPETPLSSTEPNTQKLTDQKHETMAEGFTSEDGSVIVSKKMTRVVTTTRTTLPGEKMESNAGDLIRLKVNEQVYSGSVDPGNQHIYLVPIAKQ